MQWILNDKDYAYLRTLGISLVEDTRTPAEAEARLIPPEWLRRAIWRQFWAEQDSRSIGAEPLCVINTQARFSSNGPPITGNPPSRLGSLIDKVLAWFAEMKPHDPRSNVRVASGTVRKR